MTEENQLPPNWTVASLGDLGEWGSGGTPTRTNSAFYGDEIPWLKIGDLTDGPVWKAETSITQRGLDSSSAKLLEPGVLLVAMYGSIGKLGITKISCATNQAIAFCRHIPDLVSREYLFFCLKYLKHKLISLGQGGTQQNISQTLLKQVEISLAPLNEQCRIVEKIETLFARLDKGEEALREVQKLLARYRQSVLKAAVTGQLTADWRVKNAHRLEHGRDLLARILQTRRETWQGRGKYKEPIPLDTKNLPELPEGWAWAPLEGLCVPHKNSLKAGPFGSSLKKSDYSKSGYKIYGQEQVIAGNWRVGDYFIDRRKYEELENCKVAPGDVLISLVGTIGKVLILPLGCADGIINPRLVKVSLNQEAYMPGFFKLYFESDFLKSLYKLDAHGATMDILNLGIIKKLPYPLCSVKEQCEIVARVSSAFATADNVEASCKAELARLMALRQSILKEAFAGRLVPQHPEDEPASVLLASIKKTRIAKPKKPRRKARA